MSATIPTWDPDRCLWRLSVKELEPGARVELSMVPVELVALRRLTLRTPFDDPRDVYDDDAALRARQREDPWASAVDVEAIEVGRWLVCTACYAALHCHGCNDDERFSGVIAQAGERISLKFHNARGAPLSFDGELSCTRPRPRRDDPNATDLQRAIRAFQRKAAR